MRNTSNLPKPQHIVVDYSGLSDINVRLSGLGYNGDQIASSIHQAQFNAAMQGQSMGAAGGLAGALVGTMLVKSAAESAAQKEKNAPVAMAIAKVKALNFTDIMNQAALNEHFTLYTEEQQEGLPKSHYKMTPFISFSANYLNMQLIVQLERIKNKKVVYRNYFQITSPMLLKENASLNNVNNISNEAYSAMIVNMLDHMPKMISGEFGQWREVNKSSKGIKFKRRRYTYYERGQVLEKNDDYIIYRNLRGEIKLHPYDVML